MRMTPDEIQTLRYAILEKALPDIPFDGWTMAVFESAAVSLGHDETIVRAVFPQGLHDTLKTFSSHADAAMLKALADDQVETIRIRDKVARAVETRIDCLLPYKDCVRQTASLLARPQYLRLAGAMTWNTADKIWNWAGDTATDYNHYTKRGLLSGVISATMLYWLQDDSEDARKTRDFLRRRIENALFIGKTAAPVIKPVASLLERFIVRRTA